MQTFSHLHGQFGDYMNHFIKARNIVLEIGSRQKKQARTQSRLLYEHGTTKRTIFRSQES